MLDTEQTVAAVATPAGTGGIGVVRISGPDALTVADRVFRHKNGKKPSQTPGYTALYGHVYDGDQPLDEVICLVFRGPASFTGEDTAELSCHGGSYLLSRVLRACLKAGAKPAGPGEFTRRAFLNGKLDLVQAEAVAALIGARGDGAAKAALENREGRLSRTLQAEAEKLTEVAGALAASVDFPEEDLAELSPAEIRERLAAQAERLSRLAETFDQGKALTEGVSTAIIGRPNAGKSTLMNLLSGSNRSIVTEIAGTTRDVVEQTVRLGDALLNLADTAGLRRTADPVERLGVDAAKDRAATAGLILAVFDGSRPFSEEDEEVCRIARGTHAIAILNKADLPASFDRSVLEGRFDRIVSLSAKEERGLEELQEAVAQTLSLHQLEGGEGIVFSARQYGALVGGVEVLREAVAALDCGVTLDAVSILCEEALNVLLELTGKRASAAIVEEVFRNFCVGK
ncbi:MAG: tRNA uridine-5-carboxymethylaminomethyl(34) synthesis GTPase MnmE [Ruminococcaceae bacterium]|nr:tRNA uridine-5-carboxymethylaminomethyl(34) synthesis GTPase MnmE [Oscillospiraceae bacterium]